MNSTTVSRPPAQHPIRQLFLWAGCSLFLGVSGCSLVEGLTSNDTSDGLEQPKDSVFPARQNRTQTTSVPVDEFAPKPKFSNVEVIWAVPAEAVDGFVIHYGLDQSKLDSEIKVSAESLEKVSDQEKGEVYRYVVRDLPNDRPIFVAISAYAGEKSSPLSEIREIAAQ